MMAYDFYIPCSPEEMDVATLTDDGKIAFHDQGVIDEIETYLSLIELGFEPDKEQPLCVEAYIRWNADPLSFICKGNIIPVMDVGLAATAWVEKARDLTYGYFPTVLMYKSITLLNNYFLGRLYPHKEIRSLISEISDKVRERSKPMSYLPENRFSLLSAMYALESIGEIKNQEQFYGGMLHNVDAFCECSIEAINAIVGFDTRDKSKPWRFTEQYNREYDLAKKSLAVSAIKKIGHVQKARGGLK